MEETEKLIRTLKGRINDDNCFEFGNNIDGCVIKASNYILKVRFDECADVYFGEKGGCDCIFVFPYKVCIVECTTGKFGSMDAKRKIEQVKKCIKLVRSLGYGGLIEIVVYSDRFESMAMNKLKLKFKKIATVRFLRCGRDPL